MGYQALSKYHTLAKVLYIGGRGYLVYACLAAFCAANFASIFFLAARTISSRRRCRDASLSSRLELQALPLGAAASVSDSSLSFKLYRVIRSGWDGLLGCREAAGVLCCVDCRTG